MKTRLKPLNEQVIVITGATSGIGLATALEAAKHGAKLVLTSRNEEDLRNLCERIGHEGGQAAYVVADVGVDSQVQRVAEVAIQRFGGFDTWVNNAGVSVYGRLVDVPIEDKKRVFDTNFWGVVHGCKAAVKHLRERGGSIINIGSEASVHPLPLQGIYSASKHAVKAYTDSLRMELAEEGAPISVTLIKPSAINTPFASHAKNRMEKEPELPPPLYAPEVVARAILACAEKPVPSLFVGGTGATLGIVESLLPRLVEKIGEWVFSQRQQTRRPIRRDEGLTRRPTHEGELYGEATLHMRRSSLYTTAALHPLATTLIVAGIGSVIIQSLRQTRGVRRVPSVPFQRQRRLAA